MAAAPKIRVTVCDNGDDDAAAKVVSFDATCTLDQLKERAAQKLASATPFARVFLQNGAEIDDIEDVQPDDVLFFSKGEDFAVPDLASEVVELSAADLARVDASASEEQKQHVLASIAASVTSAASRLYDQSSTFVKAKSPGFVKVTLEKVEGSAHAIARHPTTQGLLSRVTSYGMWADDQLDAAYTSLRQRQSEFLASPVAQTVNSNLVLPLRARVVDPASSFFQTSSDKFRELQAQATAQGAETKVSVDQFVAGVREKLGKKWNENLLAPTQAFYTAASENLKGAREKLGKTWDDQVVPNYKARVAQPAQSFYDTALQSYANLASTGGGQVTMAEFEAGMRATMGKVWNERLVAPAQHLYSMFSQGQTADAKRAE